MVNKAIEALISAGKGFQLVGRLMRSGKDTEAKKILSKLKGADKKKAIVEYESQAKKIKEGAHSQRKFKDNKDVGVKDIDKNVASRERQKARDAKPMKPVTNKSNQSNLEVSNKTSKARTEQKERYAASDKRKDFEAKEQSIMVENKMNRRFEHEINFMDDSIMGTPEEIAFKNKEIGLKKDRSALMKKMAGGAAVGAGVTAGASDWRKATPEQKKANDRKAEIALVKKQLQEDDAAKHKKQFGVEGIEAGLIGVEDIIGGVIGGIAGKGAKQLLKKMPGQNVMNAMEQAKALTKRNSESAGVVDIAKMAGAKKDPKTELVEISKKLKDTTPDVGLVEIASKGKGEGSAAKSAIKQMKPKEQTLANEAWESPLKALQEKNLVDKLRKAREKKKKRYKDSKGNDIPSKFTD